ncbi:MAG: S8/S53 family peptidase [Ignavibacteriaceae bacterium]|jgi:subtilisin family serine protease|nr:S8/S53 family peptidase [Ignavibacteriaceae bacterium]
MRNITIALVLLGTLNVFAQNSNEKISKRLQTEIQSKGQMENYLIWVDFSDKGNDIQKYFDNPETVVTQKSLERRAKVLDKSGLLKYSDLPVNQTYIEQLIKDGFIIKQKSKWFNAVSGYAALDVINRISQYPFVKQLDIVGIYVSRKDDVEYEYSKNVINKITQPEGIYSLNYGDSFTQLNQINVPAVHDSGYNGAGIVICVMDAGFSNLTHEVFSIMNIASTYDFATHSPNLTGHSHGTATLSLIGGFKQGELIGPAYGATFLLARTEVDPGETPQEEDNWIAAMEWADSLGVDVTSTSLGYLDFDPPYTSYTWQDMDGNTARITIAADYAVSLGITVVNSAGNEGNNSSHNTLGAPADGDSVITIGAVSSSGAVTYFSSVGPTVDGRIKPDLMAMGSNDYIATTSGNGYSYGSGTSFSCPLVAGVCALLLQKNPLLTPMEVLDILRSTASRSTNPNNQYGWGIINALSAINAIVVPVELTSFKAEYVNGKVELQWITASETNNYGFEIERKEITGTYQTIGFVSGSGSSTNRITYNYTDNNLNAAGYIYRLKQIDLDGSYDYSNEVEVFITGLNEYKLFQNYPNPFNPVTTLQFIIPEEGNVKITLYDMLGNEVKTLLNENVISGSYNLSVDGSDLSSGTYFVKMLTKSGQQVIKMSLLK